MKKLIYIPNQKHNMFFDKDTPDFITEGKLLKEQKKLRKLIK